MNRIIVVGTLHLKLTRKNDLEKLLDDISPDQLLVELPEEKSAREEAVKVADEMGFATTWASTKSIPVGFFDTGMSVLKEGVSEEDPEYQELVNREIWEAQAFSWQELNKKEPWKKGRLADVQWEFWRKYIDPHKWEVREEKMLENIKRLKIPQGTVLILTGAGHLDFFERELPEAEFPFRH